MPKPRFQTLRLPKGWKSHVRSAVLHVISLARYSLLTARGQAETDRGTDRLEAGGLTAARGIAHQRCPDGTSTVHASTAFSADRTYGNPGTAGGSRLVDRPSCQSLSGHRSDDQQLDVPPRRRGPRGVSCDSRAGQQVPHFVQYLVRRLPVLCPTMGKVKWRRPLRVLECT